MRKVVAMSPPIKMTPAGIPKAGCVKILIIPHKKAIPSILQVWTVTKKGGCLLSIVFVLNRPITSFISITC